MDAKQLNKRQSEILDAKQAVINAKREAGVGLTDSEKESFKNFDGELSSIDFQLKELNDIQTRRTSINAPRENFAVSNNTNDGKRKFYAMGSTHTSNPLTQVDPTVIDSRLAEGMWASLKHGRSGFEKFCFENAVLGEGGTTADGSALVPIQTDPTIPNLAPYESSGRKLSRVISTEMDLNIPYQSAKGSAALKAETNNGNTNAFTASVPQFATTKLASYMIGVQVGVSWELLQDSKALATFVTDEIQRNIVAAEENYFVNGSGSTQPQGYLASGVASTPTGANITAGVGSIASNGIKPILELVASLNPNYYGNAKFLTHRQEFVRLQEAQLATSQFQTYVTWDADGNARLLGHPVLFSYEMPVYSASPSTDGSWLFGDFNAFATLGDRGGSGIRIKVLDQVAAQNGQTVILGYRRSDQRIVLGEAVYQLQTNG